MRSRTLSLALAGTLGLGALGAVVAPAVATAATTQESVAEALGDRVGRITDALSGLVTDGTLTQEQADAVAQTLDEALPERGHGGHGLGHGLRASIGDALDVLGLTAQELRTQLQAGQTLTEVAEAQGVPVEDVSAALTARAQERLAEAVTDGRLTQEQADERLAALDARVAELLVRDDLGDLGDGRGGRGGHGGGPDGGPDGGLLDEAPEEPTTEGSSSTGGVVVVPA